MKSLINTIYYLVRPIIPRGVQISLRRMVIRKQRLKYLEVWPISENSKSPPAGWNGWPERKKFALVLTHDVETAKGQAKTEKLMHLEMELGFRSAFYFVPERYSVAPELRSLLVQNGFEVGVHGLNHDGKLYQSEKIFRQRARKINQYLDDWKAVGFRSPCMHHNLEWIGQLDIEYDASTFDTDPFEPQADGTDTIFPFYVHNRSTGRGYVELPYTLVQDFTLFISMQEKNIDIWKQKLDWIVEQGGMALFITHPDYMNFQKGESRRDSYPVDHYLEFLRYVEEYYAGQYWPALPREVAQFYINELQKATDMPTAKLWAF